MNIPAKNTDKPDINHLFRRPEGVSERFFVMGYCSQTLKNRSPGSAITLGTWLLECYSDFAGDIYFLNNRTKKKGSREKNSLHLYAPGCRIREDTRNADLPLRETFIVFASGETYGLDRLMGNKSKFCRFLDPEEMAISAMLEAAEAVSVNGDRAFWQVHSLFVKCLDHLFNSSAKTGEDTYEIRENTVSSEQALIRKAEDFMRENISSNVSNSDIAKLLNMSESSFCHKFKKATGIPPNSRLMEMRIDAAKNLLLKGAKLKYISETVGFRDEFYLSRIFKKKTGLSPKAFRDGIGRPSKIPGET